MSFRVPRLRRKTKFIRPSKMENAPHHSSCRTPGCTADHGAASTITVSTREKDAIPASSRITGPDEDPTDITVTVPPVPALYTTLPPLRDNAPATVSSVAQDEAVKECLPLMAQEDIDADQLSEQGLPKLQWARHIKFLRNSITMTYPAGWVGLDPSRPWSVYWAINGLYMLGEDVSQYTDRIIATAQQAQHPDGGFGGGYGQYAHSATTYAMVLALVTAGGEEALRVIDRKKMWHWLGRMKQKDGGFTVCAGGEEDIRGAYCSMTIIALLNLPLELPPDSPARVNGDETFLTGLPEWVSKCQTFEGGIAGMHNSESHGAYAFCALGCLSIIGPPATMIPKYLDVPALVQHLSSLQHAPESGFAGRTNKLVDGCYSHWVGGCWSLLTAALGLVVTDLWSREGLARYILSCCQGPRGGLRDKPSKSPDAYHSNYCLAGLSAAQYVAEYVEPAGETAEEVKSELDDEQAGIVPLTAPFRWTISGTSNGPWTKDVLVKPVHPVFVIPVGKANECRQYFETHVGFE